MYRLPYWIKISAWKNNSPSIASRKWFTNFASNRREKKIGPKKEDNEEVKIDLKYSVGKDEKRKKDEEILEENISYDFASSSL